jgi:hypothetical protein
MRVLQKAHTTTMREIDWTLQPPILQLRNYKGSGVYMLLSPRCTAIGLLSSAIAVSNRIDAPVIARGASQFAFKLTFKPIKNIFRIAMKLWLSTLNHRWRYKLRSKSLNFCY